MTSSLATAAAGVPTGFIDLDAILLGGLKRGTLNVLASRASGGKSALAGNVILHAARLPARLPKLSNDEGAPAEPEDGVLFFSLEMPTRQVIDRFVSMLSGVPVERLDGGEIADAEWPKVVAAVENISRRQVWIDDAQEGLAVSQIHARVRQTEARLRARGARLSLVVIDAFHLLQADASHETLEGEFSTVSHQIKKLAAGMGVPLLVVCPLSRPDDSASETRAFRRPKLEDFGQWASLAEAAHMVTAIHHVEEEESGYPQGLAELLVLKNRHGETGVARVAWIPKRLTFGNVALG